ncbi:MAG: bifunctional (p)ppGpp synthetase/guanosine-3',5'-bis(diphosphate) 3'-pyrophosphohydrolase [Gemmatimonadota bacterium]|nr:bifunctional (p)ppGpp synthetase/guanosine-3',5'-bis(diphosphate) 3'-pyrophosphohydrolase [Gemmatimonadota bacterium]MDE3005514.1 bifunctional (p)ppGpp synthetase/guanosine-3',5'-bis(diphosphate) 3'-pyrophosphohydrolase [Gemmatimonadota bacterium]
MAVNSSRVSGDAILGLPRPLARCLEGYTERLDVDAIRRAYDLAVEAHTGQTRASGAEYVSHTVDVAIILAQLRLDTDTIVAGLIHDTIEDTDVTLRDIEERFGTQVAAIVDGVTKLGKVQFRSATEQQVENYRKMLLSMASDARVILVKLADRLHNMRTLEHLPDHKRRRIALETREIYAPLAHRLGVAAIRWELEDLAFKFLEPEEYEALGKKLRQRRRTRERQILEMQRPLEEELEAAGIKAVVSGRPKHLWSIHRKIVTQNRPFDDIYDLMAMRVLTANIQDCYAALGIIHSKWTPIPERFHDYVATPKSNMYRSLHTTVFGPGGRRYEIQIRTEEMHRTSEYGIAAHWRYKEDGDARSDEADEALTWFRQVLEWQQDTAEPEEFMEFLRMDLFRGEIFVFTPDGDVKALPVGATPIDFAYSVHTEVGNHCAGSKVNGRIAPLSRELKNGDAIEILTNPKQRPNRDWLSFVKTSRARQSIRQWIRREEFDSALRLGKELLEKELKKARRTLPSDADARLEASINLGYDDFERVQAALGRGEVGPTAVIKQFFPDHDPAEAARREPSALSRLAARLRISGRGVRIQGMDNLMVRYSRCCQPVPGDPVIGYITRGRGVSIHRKDCPNVLALSRDPERRIEIEWAAEKGDRFFVKLFMRGSDRRGLLSDVAKAITDTGTDISHADMRTTEGGMHGEFVVEVRDLAHLEKVRRSIGRVKGVLDVERREHFEEDDLGWA